VEYRVLGPLEAVDGDERIALGGPKQRAVLALLIADAGRPVPMGTLIEGAYGDDAPERVHRSVHTFISNLRSALGDVIERHGDGYTFTADRSRIDACVFEDLVAQAADEDDPAEAVAFLRRALELWRSHAYVDAECHSLLAAERTRLHELRIAAIEAKVDAELASGRDRELIAELESLTSEHPLHERFRAQHMLALYRAGRQGEALRAYERARAFLVDELGLDPSLELRELEQRILEQDTSLIVDLRPKVKRAAILIADVANPDALARLAPDDRHRLLSTQAAAIDDAVTSHQGRVLAQRGSAVYATFGAAVDAAHAAIAVQTRTADRAVQPRVALASGDVEVMDDDDITGPPISRAAALVAVAHGGQVLVAAEAQAAIAASGTPGLMIRSLGAHEVAGIAEGELIYELSVDGQVEFPPLRLGQLPPPLPFAERGLPGYELRDEVGAGAHGTVHRAYQPSIGREVAIKTVHPEHANQADFIRRFEVDAQLVARLEHPHIVPMHDYWRDPDGAYLVMRWMSGGSLADRLDGAPLGLGEADELVRSIGAALDYAHRHGVVHGGIRSSNVLFDDDANPYLTDFVIAGPVNEGGDHVARDVQALVRLVDRCLADKGPVDAVLSAGSSDGGYATVPELLDAWQGAMGEGAEAIVYTSTRNPYKGLRAFTELDADDFHGRDTEVAKIVESLRRLRLVAVVGPSGIGKSSVTRAGVVPALRRGAIDGSDQWLITDMLPGRYPFEELTSALMRVAVDVPTSLEDDLRRDERGLARTANRYLPRGQRLLLIVDQFEELFTLSSDDDRSAFLAMLAATIADERSNVRVILTIRADFFDRPLRFADLGDALREGTVPIAAPSHGALADAITLPSNGVGVRFEAGLVERVVADVAGQPGALPLLEYSLTELFDGRTSNTLTFGAYLDAGGVLGSLGRRAESIYDGIPEPARSAAATVFLRLVNVDASGRVTRQRAAVSDLRHLGVPAEDIDAIVGAFAGHRLFTLDRDPVSRLPTVEVAHESLFSRWPRLAAWIEAQREDLVMKGRLATATGDWLASDRDAAYLLTGGRLRQHEAWTDTTTVPLTTAERDLLGNSRAAEEQRHAKARRTRRWVMAGFAAAAVIATVLAATALAASNERGRQADAAEGRALLASSSAVLSEDPELAVLLALAGTDALGNDSESVAAVRRAASEVKTIYYGRWADDRISRSATGDLSPDGTTVAVSGGIGSYFEVRSIDRDEVMWTHEFDVERSEDLQISLKYFDGGAQLLVAVNWYPPSEYEFDSPPEAAGLYAFDAADGTLIRTFDSGRCGAALTADNFSHGFSANQYSDTNALVSTYAESFGGCGESTSPPSWDVLLVDLMTGEQTTVITEWSATNGPISAALSADGSTMIVPGEVDAGIHETLVVDTADNSPVGMLPVSADNFTFALSRDGTLAAVAGGFPFGRIELYDTGTGELVQTLLGEVDGVGGMAFTAREDRIVSTGRDGVTRIWEVGSGRLLDGLAGAEAAGTVIRIADGDDRLAVHTQGDTFRVYGLDASPLAESGSMAPCGALDDGPFPLRGGVHATSGPTVVYVGCDSTWGTVHLWNRATGEVTTHTGFDGQAVAATPDGRAFAALRAIVATEDAFVAGPYEVYDWESGQSVLELTGVCAIDFGRGEPVGEDCSVFPERPIPPMDQALPVGFSAWELEFSRDGRFVGGGDWNSTGFVWDASTGEPVLLTSGRSVAFAPNGERVAFFAQTERELNLFETADFTLVASHSLDDAEPAGFDLAFALGGDVLLGTPGPDGASDIVIYDGGTLTPTAELENPHQGETRDIAVSADGTRFATAGSDGTVKVWDARSLSLLHDIPIADVRVQSVDFVDDDSKLVASALDGRVVEVLLDPDEYLAHVRAHLPRGFTPTECAVYFTDRACPEFDV
jgi:DNA-binding SARP family transcriptional activator/WD40 repeat protein/tRNA A-37 threonylcarbamoyl transferase component Bud32